MKVQNYGSYGSRFERRARGEIPSFNDLMASARLKCLGGGLFLSSSSFSKLESITRRTPRTRKIIISSVQIWRPVPAKSDSSSWRASWAGRWSGRSSSVCLKWRTASWWWPYALSISPKVKCWFHALLSGAWSSNDLLARNKASSRYCNVKSSLAKLWRTSGLLGATAKPLRKHSMALNVCPLILQKFPIWLYSCMELGFWKTVTI